jgi:hypothetical protein
MSGPRFLDLALTVFFLVLGVLAILGVRHFPFDDQLFPVTAAVQIGSVLGPVAAIVGLILGVLVFGHLIAVPVFVFVYMLWKREPVWIALAGAILMFAFIRGLLIEVMHVVMPHPYLGSWLPF